MTRKKKIIAALVVVYVVVAVGLYVAIDVAKAERATLLRAASQLEYKRKHIEMANRNSERRLERIALIEAELERCEAEKHAIRDEVSESPDDEGSR